MNRGITLLELLLVMGILVIIGFGGLSLYYTFQRDIDIEEEGNRIAGVLRQAKGNSMAVEQGYAWGVHFENPSAADPFFTLFAGPTYAGSATTTRYTLSPQIEYQTPTSGSSIDVLFTKRGGTTTAATTIIIRLKNNTARTKIVDVTAEGLIAR